MTTPHAPRQVSGYVLAGGRSSRMGRDKALLELTGRPLIEHAVSKLRRVCGQVSVLSAQPSLAAYAPLVPDLRPGCGPLSGMEAALAHARYEWSLILPVDVPFLPAAMLDAWASDTLHAAPAGTRLAMHVVEGKPQPALLMLHRDLAAYVSAALDRGEFKVMPVLLTAARDLAARRGLSPRRLLRQWTWEERSPSPLLPDETKAQTWPQILGSRAGSAREYFANLNTPDDFAFAERNVDLLDRLETK